MRYSGSEYVLASPEPVEGDPLLLRAPRSIRRRRVPGSRCYSVYQEFDDIGQSARTIGDQHAAALLKIEARNRIIRRTRPLSTWEQDSLELRETDPNAAAAHRPRSEAALILSSTTSIDPAPINDASHLMADLQRRTDLVASTDLFMNEKRVIAREERRNLAKARRELTWLQLALYSTHNFIRQEWRRLGAFMHDFRVWGGLIRRVDAKFGTAVGSYFELIRWMLLINTLVAIIMIGFLVVPMALFGYPDAGSFTFNNVFFADGFFARSLLFIGAYEPTAVGDTTNCNTDTPTPNANTKQGASYRMALAYFLTVVGCFSLLLYALVHSLARRFAAGQTATTSGSFVPYSALVFAGWEHVVASASSARIKHQGLARALKETLAEDLRGKVSRSACQVASVYALRAAVNLVVLGLLAGAVYAIFRVSQEYTNNPSSIKALFPALVIALFNFLLPEIFEKLAVLERFRSPRTVLRITLARSFILRMMGIYAMMVSLFGITITGTDSSNLLAGCWETVIGQVIYRLLLVDTTINILGTICADMAKAVLFRHAPRCVAHLLSPPEFPLSTHVLDEFYRQALCWVGMFYSPLLPLVFCISTLLIGYIKERSLAWFLHPPKNVFRASNSNNFYVGMLLLTLLVSAGPVIYSMVEKTPSTTCGPFRNMSSVFDIIPETIDDMAAGPRAFFDFVITPAFIAPVLMVVFLLLYYYYRQAGQKGELARHLERLLHKEHDEKRALLAAFREQLKGTAPIRRGPSAHAASKRLEQSGGAGADAGAGAVVFQEDFF